MCMFKIQLSEFGESEIFEQYKHQKDAHTLHTIENNTRKQKKKEKKKVFNSLIWYSTYTVRIICTCRIEGKRRQRLADTNKDTKVFIFSLLSCRLSVPQLNQIYSNAIKLCYDRQSAGLNTTTIHSNQQRDNNKLYEQKNRINVPIILMYLSCAQHSL